MGKYLGITPDYVAGLVDGEGCFEITVNKQPRFKFGFQIKPEFWIRFRDEGGILRKIRECMGVSGLIYPPRPHPIYSTNPEALGVVRINDLKKVKCFFKKHPLFVKRKAFGVWSKAVEVYDKVQRRKGGMTKEEFLESAKLRREIHKYLGVKRRRVYFYEDLKRAANGVKG